MAEAIALAASIIQIAGAGATLSKALYNFVGSVSRADQEIADVAGDVNITVTALNRVSEVFTDVDIQSVISRKAVQDAGNLIERCEAIFGELSKIVEKRKKTRQDSTTSISALGRLSWPFKEEKVELLRRRLESLKNSLILLLHVLQLASLQNKGQVERRALDEEIEKIRQLHQTEQASLKKLQALESKLDRFELSNEQAIQTLNSPSETSSNQTFTTLAIGNGHDVAKRNDQPTMISVEQPETTFPLVSSTVAGNIDGINKEEPLLTTNDLSRCSAHVQELLNKITLLQTTLEATTPTLSCPKVQVETLYRNFCQSFESEMTPRPNLVTYFPSYNMGSNLPEIHEFGHSLGLVHENIHSDGVNSNIPTPVSQAGPRSPLLGPDTWHNHHLRAASVGSLSSEGEDMESPRRNYTFKRTEEPPRNNEGRLICKHTECSDITFNRKCEWSKHMDRHDRPYKCKIKGCEKIQGFTYSGGLLRHEREVHKMHGGTRKPLYCPYPDCRRSTGPVFTRKENLAEHIRRVHRRTRMIQREPVAYELPASLNLRGLDALETISQELFLEQRSPISSVYAIDTPYSWGRDEQLIQKRKHTMDGDPSEHDVEEPHTEPKRPRLENEHQDTSLGDESQRDIVSVLLERWTNGAQESESTLDDDAVELSLNTV